MMIELKNGETYNGHLVDSDCFMNLHLKDVICTSKDGDKFWKMSEIFIRGVNIKFLRIPSEILNSVKEENTAKAKHRNQFNRPKNSTFRLIDV
ncbi:hypothetical protein HZS_6349 [Henneguya salminicola]|nr:hypothetical protein HZS_6349 [Henneguya salminicola]